MNFRRAMLSFNENDLTLVSFRTPVQKNKFSLQGHQTPRTCRIWSNETYWESQWDTNFAMLNLVDSVRLASQSTFFLLVTSPFKASLLYFPIETPLRPSIWEDRWHRDFTRNFWNISTLKFWVRFEFQIETNSKLSNWRACSRPLSQVKNFNSDIS